MASSPDTKSAVWGWIKDLDSENDTPAQAASDAAADKFPGTASTCALDTSTGSVRKPSFKKRLRPLGDLKRLGAPGGESVGVIAGAPLIPSPSHLSVEQCYELLAKPPPGVATATAAQPTEQ